MRWRQVRTSNRQRRRLEALNKHLLFSLFKLSRGPFTNSNWVDGKINGDVNRNGVWESIEKWTETCPFDGDSDDDGVLDGNEKDTNGNEWWEDYDEDGMINAVDPDSDNDELYDGLERGYRPYKAGLYTDLSRPYFVPDIGQIKDLPCMGSQAFPYTDHNTTDPFDDDSDRRKIGDFPCPSRMRGRDDDTIKDGTEDVNNNGRIDGDNGDGIKTNTEAWEETDPNSKDTDSDGIEDNDEISWEYDPCSNDTDHDGLTDNIEDVNKNGIKDTTETSVILFDTDGDGLSDKLELDGWKIVVFEEKDGSIISEYCEDSDPNDPDIDGDGLTDFEEYTYGCDPRKINTDGDYKNDYEEVNSQYGSSPSGKDGIPPIITSLEYKLEQKYEGFTVLKVATGFKVMVIIEAEDIDSYVTYIECELIGIETKRMEYGDNDKYIYSYNFEFDYLKGIQNGILGNGLKMKIFLADYNDNVGYTSFNTENIFDNIITKVGIILSNVVDFGKEYLSFLKELFYSIIDKIIEPKLKDLIISVPSEKLLTHLDDIKVIILNIIIFVFKILKIVINEIAEIFEFIFMNIYYPIYKPFLEKAGIDIKEVFKILNELKEAIFNTVDEVLEYIKNTKSLTILSDLIYAEGIFADFDLLNIIGFRNKLISSSQFRNNPDFNLKTNSDIDFITITGESEWLTENLNWQNILKTKYAASSVCNFDPETTSLNNINKIFYELSRYDKSEKSIFISISLHGDGQSFILPDGNKLFYSNLSYYLSLLSYDQCYIIIDSCYSGNIIKSINKYCDLIITSSSNDQISLGRISYTLSLLMSKSYNPSLDYNNDNIVSLDECYYYMIDNNLNGIENPMIFQSESYNNIFLPLKDNVTLIGYNTPAIRDCGLSFAAGSAKVTVDLLVAAKIFFTFLAIYITIAYIRSLAFQTRVILAMEYINSGEYELAYEYVCTIISDYGIEHDRARRRYNEYVGPDNFFHDIDEAIEYANEMRNKVKENDDHELWFADMDKLRSGTGKMTVSSNAKKYTFLRISYVYFNHGKASTIAYNMNYWEYMLDFSTEYIIFPLIIPIHFRHWAYDPYYLEKYGPGLDFPYMIYPTLVWGN